MLRIVLLLLVVLLRPTTLGDSLDVVMYDNQFKRCEACPPIELRVFEYDWVRH